MLAKPAAILFFCVCFLQRLSAQQAQQLVGPADVTALVEKNAAALRMSTYERQNTRISDAYFSKQSGVLLVYLQQTYKGVDVHNALKVLAYKDGQLVSSAGDIVHRAQLKANNTEGTPGIRPESAVSAAARHLNLNLPATISIRPSKYNDENKETAFSGFGIANDSIKTRLLWMPDSTGQRLTLVWQVEIQPVKTSDHWLVRIDAATGGFVNKANLTVSCNWKTPAHKHTVECYEERVYNGDNAAPVVGAFKNPDAINSAKYRVIPFPVEAPTFPGGTPTLVTNPWLLSPAGSPATTLKWNDNGTTSFAISRGNNVYAQDDHDANDNTIGQSAKSITPVPDLDFDYSPTFSGEPQDSLNMGFSLTNLFYWNNIMHDLSYQYGFDEVSGNFQQSNQGRGGLGNDYVIADGQDAVALDNSNFATPADGQNPRMQMFLFDFDQSKLFTVNSPASFAGYKNAVEGQLSTNNSLATKGPVTGNLVLFRDVSNSDSACNSASNGASIKGNIALIMRGDCNFTVKIKNAQLAGAKAVVMIDQNPGEAPIIMGGTDNTITIPAVMISYEDGNTIKNLLAQHQTVNVTLKIHLMDGSVDAGVMCHEYTHGISNRLTGGPAEAECLENAEQMGEGWSDYYAIMATTDWTKAQLTDGAKAKTIGTYVLNETPDGDGIRQYPYSTNTSINPWTYADIATQTGGEVHLIGEIWCTTLWEMTWGIIQQDAFINKDLFNALAPGGNSVALRLVTEGMKLQRCGPGFIDGRDAILKADTLLYGGKYSCSIWKAFAKRGMGLKASEGSANSYTDQIADFTVPSNALITKTVDKDSAAQLDVLTYTVTAACRCADVSNLQIKDILPPNVTYISGGTYSQADNSVTFSNVSLAASQSQSFTVKVKVNDGSYFKPVTPLNDSVNNNIFPNTIWKNVSTTGNTWKVSTAEHHTGSYAYYALDDTTKFDDESLVTKDIYPLKGLSTLSFWHYFDTEAGYDGGVAEISTDTGATWQDLGAYMYKNGYNNVIDKNNGTTLSGRTAFSGTSFGMINTLVNLSTFAGKNAMFRFRFANDDINGGDGWYIDDITLQSTAAVYNNVGLYKADSLQSAASATSIIKAGALAISWGSLTAIKQNNTSLLSWNTQQEINTGRFAIERSQDGIDFYEIGSVKAAGNSNNALNYQFTDISPLQGTDYYRVKELDKDGKFQYSETRMLTFSDASGAVSITPNPAKDKISITVAGNTGPLKVILINSLGQRLQIYDMQGQYMQLNLPPVAAGVYYIRIEGRELASQHKLVIE